MSMFREPPFREMKPYVKIMALVLVMILSFLVVLAFGVGLSIPFFGKNLMAGPDTFSNYSDPGTIAMLKYLQMVNQLGAFIIPAFIFVFLTDDNYKGYLKLDSRFKSFGPIFGIVLLFVSLPFIGWLIDINGNLHLPEFMGGIERWMRESEDKAENLTDAFLSSSSWIGFFINLVMIGILAALGEELIFRGILLRLFHEWTRNTHLAVVISALIFSAFHLQFYGFFARFILGITLGYLFVWTGSLWVPIIVHFVNNALAVVVSFLDQRGIITVQLENFGTSKNAVVIAGSGIMMVFIMVMIRLHENGYFKKRREWDSNP